MVKAIEGHAAIHLLDRVAEAEDMPLKVVQRAVLSSTSHMGRQRQQRGTLPSTSLTMWMA